MGDQSLTRDRVLVQKYIPRIRISGKVTNDEGTIIADYTGDSSLDLADELMLLDTSELQSLLDPVAQTLLFRKAGI